jgi:hypothetical protein
MYLFVSEDETCRRREEKHGLPIRRSFHAIPVKNAYQEVCRLLLALSQVYFTRRMLSLEPLT